MKDPRSPFLENDEVIFYDRKMRSYYDILRAGGESNVSGNRLAHDEIIGRVEGFKLLSQRESPFWVLRPTLSEHIVNMRRGATVIYPKDLGMILQYGDVFPGAKIVEAGFGSGALATTLLRAVGHEGTVISYELRPDFIKNARQNMTRFMGEAPNHIVREVDIYESFEEEEVDRLFLDLPEPWRVLPLTSGKLRPGAIIGSYSPTVLQLKAFADEIERSRSFASVISMEVLIRTWHIDKRSVRPDQRMIGHTGFLTFARYIDRGGQ